MRKSIVLLAVAAGVAAAPPGIAVAKAPPRIRSCASVAVGQYQATNVRATASLGCSAAGANLRTWLKHPTNLPHSAKAWHSKLVRGTWQAAYRRLPVSLYFVLTKLTKPTSPQASPPTTTTTTTTTTTPATTTTTTPTPTPTPPAEQTITFASTVPATPTAGTVYMVDATASSGLPVTFSIDSSSDPGACTIHGSAVSFKAVGTCVIDANQAGDSTHNKAPQVQQTIVVLPASTDQTITFASTVPATPTAGTIYMVDAKASSGLPVTFSIDSSSDPGACTIAGSAVSFKAAGICVIDANQAGDSTHNKAPQVQQTIVVLPASTLSVSLTSAGQPFAASYQWSTVARTGAASCVDATGLKCTVTAKFDGTATTDPTAIPLTVNVAGVSHTVVVSATDSVGATVSTSYTYKVTPIGYYGITFDDGPSAATTPAVIAALQDQTLPGLVPGPTASVPSHIPATFMLVGSSVATDSKDAAQEAADGFQIGDHTWNHVDIGDSTDTVNGYDTVTCTSPLQTPSAAPTVFGTFTVGGLFGTKVTALCPQYEIEDTALEIHATTGVWPQWFRPPYGDYGPATGPSANNQVNTQNTPALLSTVQADAAMKAAGAPTTAMSITGWSTDSLDWCTTPDATTCVTGKFETSAEVAANAATVSAGGIILMHDADTTTTAGAIPLLIRALAAKGLLAGNLATTTVPQAGPWVPLPPYFVTAVAP